MNPAFVTTHDGRRLRNVDEALHDWHAGKPFRLYLYGPVTIHDSVRLLMSKFTHVRFLWQDENFVVHHHDLEIVVPKEPK